MYKNILTCVKNVGYNFQDTSKLQHFSSLLLVVLLFSKLDPGLELPN